MIDKTAILLLQMGGPDSLEAVEPFLLNLFSDRDIIRLGPAFFQPVLARWIARRRAPKVEAQYEKIGGRSPIRELTSAQALALEEKLGQGFRCFPAMRYWRPSTIEALAAVKKEGISRIFALPLYPHYSRATTGSSFNELRRVLALSGVKFSLSCIESFHNHPLYIAALARTLEEGLGFFPRGARGHPALLGPFPARFLHRKRRPVPFPGGRDGAVGDGAVPEIPVSAGLPVKGGTGEMAGAVH